MLACSGNVKLPKNLPDQTKFYRTCPAVLWISESPQSYLVPVKHFEFLLSIFSIENLPSDNYTFRQILYPQSPLSVIHLLQMCSFIFPFEVVSSFPWQLPTRQRPSSAITWLINAIINNICSQFHNSSSQADLQRGSMVDRKNISFFQGGMKLPN